MAAQRSAQAGDEAVGGKQQGTGGGGGGGVGEGADGRGKLFVRVMVATCSLSSGLHLQGCSSDSTGQAQTERQRQREGRWRDRGRGVREMIPVTALKRSQAATAMPSAWTCYKCQYQFGQRQRGTKADERCSPGQFAEQALMHNCQSVL